MNTTSASDDENLRRIADALERIADRYAPQPKPVTTNITLGGNYGGTKEQLATIIRDTIRDAVKKGTIPPNWVA